MQLRSDLDKPSRQHAEQICKQIITQYNDKLVNPAAGNKAKEGGIFDQLDMSELDSIDEDKKPKAASKNDNRQETVSDHGGDEEFDMAAFLMEGGLEDELREQKAREEE